MSLTGGHLDAFLEAGLTAEQIVALVKADISEREKASEVRRAKDAERQRRHRKSRGVTVTNDDKCDPPKDNIKPPVSEANASAAEPPQDPVKQMFDLGVTILTDAGIGKERARNFVGKLKQQHGAAVVLQALLDCRAKNVSAPIDWLTKRFQVSKYVSSSGYEYKGDVRSVMREAEKRADWDTYWKAKNDMEKAA